MGRLASRGRLPTPTHFLAHLRASHARTISGANSPFAKKVSWPSPFQARSTRGISASSVRPTLPPTWRSSRITCRTSTNGSISGWPAASGREVTLADRQLRRRRLPDGWPDYRACLSTDREEWVRVDGTSYADGVLTIRFTPPADIVWLAYFAPYSMERHHDLVASVAVASRRRLPLARQEPRRPGHRLPDDRRGAAQRLALRPPAPRRDDGRMVDGRRAGKAHRPRRPGRPRASPRMHLPGRPQHEPRRVAARPPAHQRGRREPQPRMARSRRPSKSPEVLCVRNAMDETGVDFAMDIHGDEAIPANFLAGFEGIPSLTERQTRPVQAVQRHARAPVARFPDRAGL